MPSGKVTLTLQDVEVQFGLKVDGLPVAGSMDRVWRDYSEEMLSV